jgi:putative acetyltransferase
MSWMCDPSPALSNHERILSNTNGQLVVRPARSDDSAAVRQMVYGVLREYGLAPDPRATDADLDDLEGCYIARGGRFDVLVSEAGEVLGSVGLYPDPHEPGTVELRKMYLHPSVRGNGWGKRLLEHALAHARRMGFTRMTLETASVLREAISLYVRYGFQPRPERPKSCRCDQTYALDLASGPDEPAAAAGGDR